MNTGFDPHCLVQIPALPFSSCAKAVQSQMSYLTSLGLFCLGCFIGMLIALTYHVGGLNTSDKCLACGEHSEYVSNCHYGCFERSVSCHMCRAVWGKERCNSRVTVH